jgi:acyl-CoA synthetase (AMP-forming)/AMP-acid ligase II
MVLYRNSTIEQLQEQAQRQPGKDCLLDTRGRSLTYQELTSTVDQVAQGLARSGFKAGDKVLFLVRPSVEAVILSLVVMRLGGVMVAADIAMGEESFKSRVRLVNPQWVMTERILLVLSRFKLAKRILKTRGTEIPEISSISGARMVVVGSTYIPSGNAVSCEKLKNVPLQPFTEEDLGAGQDALIVFTSGTTSLPKGVVHTQGSVAATFDVERQALKPSEGDVFYSNQLFMLLLALTTGARGVVIAHKFTAKRCVADYCKYLVTKTFGIPKEFEEVVAYCAKGNSKLPVFLDSIVLGSTPVLSPFLKRFRGILHERTKVFCVYGATEILPMCVTDLEEKMKYHGTGDYLGKPLPGITIEVASDGELIARGLNLCRGYYSGDSVQEFHTGDIGTVTPEGEIVLLGRKKDMIIKGNHNIYPTMFEATVNKIPGVQNSAMVGVYSAAKGDEEVILAIERDPLFQKHNFEEYVKSALLSGEYSIDLYAQPDKIVVMSLPRSGRSSKIDKVKLREIISEIAV